MPIYEFKNKKTKKITEKFMTWAERETFLKEHTELESVMSQTQIGDPIRMGIKKPDMAWRNKLRAIKKANSEAISTHLINMTSVKIIKTDGNVMIFKNTTVYENVVFKNNYILVGHHIGHHTTPTFEKYTILMPKEVRHIETVYSEIPLKIEEEDNHPCG